MSDEHSNVTVELKNLRERVDRDRKADAERSEARLKGGGGGRTFDGMEPRVAHLESDIGHIKFDVGDIKGTLKELDTHVSDTQVSVARLESDIGNVKSDIVKSDIGDVRGTLKDLNTHVIDWCVAIATLTERVGHLPTKGYIGSMIVAQAAFVITAITLLSRFGWLVPGPPTH